MFGRAIGLHVSLLKTQAAAVLNKTNTGLELHRTALH